MKQLTCPLNGLRDISEFQYLGPRRGTDAENGETVVRHVFYHENPIGPLVEWWRHRPSNTVFLAERHTTSDQIIRTWLPDATEKDNA
jgi:sarcosine oxidase subunit delta